MNVKKWIAIALAAAMTAAVLSGCGSSVSTETETVSKTEHPVALTLDANITALHMTTIVPKLSGKIVSAPLTKGQEIQSGEIVVQIDTAPYEQSVSAAESELIAATSAAAAAPAYAPSAGDSQRRVELKAWYDMGALSRVEYNQMMSQTAAPQASAPSVDSGRIAQLQQSLQAARDMLSNATIYSPINGRITAVAENPSVAVAGNVLATIQQMTPLVATFAVPEMYVQALQAAKQAGTLQVSVIAPSGESQAGELTYLATEKDPSTGAYTAKITFNNDKDLFVPGEFYHIRISTPQEVSQITVPKTAVRTKDSGDFVYIVNESGLADARSVLTGDEEEGRVVILDGLKEGDKIIVDPPDSLEIGMKVNS